MKKDWDILKRLFFESADESADGHARCLERTAHDARFPDARTLIVYLAVQPTPREETLLKNVCNYTDIQLRRSLLLYTCFSNWTECMIVAAEALNRYSDDPYLLTLCLRAARHNGSSELGQRAFARLIDDIPRDQLDCDGFQEAILFSLSAADSDPAPCRALLDDYHTRFPEDPEYWLLLSKLEHMQGDDAAADAALRTVFDRMPQDWKACGKAPSPEQIKALIDSCHEAGRDFEREYDLCEQAWELEKLLRRDHSPG